MTDQRWQCGPRPMLISWHLMVIGHNYHPCRNERFVIFKCSFWHSQSTATAQSPVYWSSRRWCRAPRVLSIQRGCPRCRSCTSAVQPRPDEVSDWWRSSRHRHRGGMRRRRSSSVWWTLRRHVCRALSGSWVSYLDLSTPPYLRDRPWWPSAPNSYRCRSDRLWSWRDFRIWTVKTNQSDDKLTKQHLHDYIYMCAHRHS